MITYVKNKQILEMYNYSMFHRLLECNLLEKGLEQTEIICLQAVMQYGIALKFVKKQTEIICLEAVKCKPNALKYVENQTYTHRFAQLIILYLLENSPRNNWQRYVRNVTLN